MNFSCQHFPCGTLNEDIDAWLFKVKIWKVATGITSDRQLIAVVASNLEKNALAWFQAWFNSVDEPFTSWATFEKEIKKRFQSPQRKRRLRDELFELRQKNSMVEYVEEFQRLVALIGTMTAEEALYKFVRGLKPHIRNLVLIQDPTTLMEAMKMAEIFDAGTKASNNNYRFNFSPNFQRRSTPVPHDPNRMDVDAIGSTATDTLTQEECKRKGLCFYCKKRGHRAYQCRNRRANEKVNAIEHQESTDEQEYNEMLVITDTVKGRTSVRPFLAPVTISNRNYAALLDSGATMDVIDTSTVTENSLPRYRVSPPIKIVMADNTGYQITERTVLKLSHEGVECRPWLRINNPEIDWKLDKVSFEKPPKVEIDKFEDKSLVGHRAVRKYHKGSSELFLISLSKEPDIENPISKEIQIVLNKFPNLLCDSKITLPLLRDNQKGLSKRLARYVEELAEYQIKIVYKPGKTNEAADALSRLESLSTVETGQTVLPDDWPLYYKHLVLKSNIEIPNEIKKKLEDNIVNLFYDIDQDMKYPRSIEN
ncbi:Retrotransposon-derived protein PEG10 [Smittium culicis]|uniref:Retrotransposon-derived protein PEG10 n=1 Tax=Smittium culicis TaxID=133412 RepID=A0A1R1X8K7_9FUNG|nr:Retrotransposon-derived protein PEG10 [Smittium culicis]